MRVTVWLVACSAAVFATDVAAYSRHYRHNKHHGSAALRGVYKPSLLEVEIKKGEFTQAVLQNMQDDGHARRIEAFADLVDSDLSRMQSLVMDVKSGLQSASTKLNHALEQRPASKNNDTTNTHVIEPKVGKNSTAVGHSNHTKPLPANIKAALAKEQSALAGLLSHLKTNIMHFNKQEKKGKTQEGALQKRAQERLARDEKQLKDPKLSAFQYAELVNQTKMEKQEVAYWAQVQNSQHNMFHANLKMTHGLMSRVKSVIEAYETAMTKGKLDAKALKVVKDLSLPKAFIEMRSDVSSEANEYIGHLKATERLLSTPLASAGSLH